MKIQCDVCHKKKASLFCPSDEAALCHDCDHTIHHANKLAGKHKRFYLLHPTSKDSPLCDICHERRAYLFCQEDRAIICRKCDLTIHGVNEHTQKHNRFLLTGVKLGGAACSDPTSLFSKGTGSDVGTTGSTINRSSSFSNENTSSCLMVELEDNKACDTGSVSTSSISEYLIETIPGYCMEDLFDASFAPNLFCKDYEHQLEFDQDQDLQEINMCSSFPLQAWVPQSQVRSPQLSTLNVPKIDSLIGIMEMPQTNKASEGYSNWRYNGYASYNVPSISPPLNKRCKRFR